MKLLSENQIYDISMSRGQAVCPISFAKGMEEAQKLLLESASENFIEWNKSNGSWAWTEGSPQYLDAKETWTHCSLSHAKKMQEKDAEIEEMRELISESLNSVLIIGNLFNRDSPTRQMNIQINELLHEMNYKFLKVKTKGISETPNSLKEGVNCSHCSGNHLNFDCPTMANE